MEGSSEGIEIHNPQTEASNKYVEDSTKQVPGWLFKLGKVALVPSVTGLLYTSLQNSVADIADGRFKEGIIKFFPAVFVAYNSRDAWNWLDQREGNSEELDSEEV